MTIVDENCEIEFDEYRGELYVEIGSHDEFQYHTFSRATAKKLFEEMKKHFEG